MKPINEVKKITSLDNSLTEKVSAESSLYHGGEGSRGRQKKILRINPLRKSNKNTKKLLQKRILQGRKCALDQVYTMRSTAVIRGVRVPVVSGLFCRPK